MSLEPITVDPIFLNPPHDRWLKDKDFQKEQDRVEKGVLADVQRQVRKKLKLKWAPVSHGSMMTKVKLTGQVFVLTEDEINKLRVEAFAQGRRALRSELAAKIVELLD
jgi:hypothetical protein